MMICNVAISQRGLTIPNINNSGGVLNADSPITGINNSGGTLIPTPPSNQSNSTGAYIEVNITNVALESVDDSVDPAVPEYKVWFDFLVDFDDIPLYDVEKFSFYVSNRNQTESWGAQIISGLEFCEHNITSFNVSNDGYHENGIEYDLVEVYFGAPGSGVNPACNLLSSIVAQIVIDSPLIYGNANGFSTDCYDYYNYYEAIIDITGAEVLMRSTQNIVSISGDTSSKDYYLPACFKDDLTSENSYDINLMLNNLTSTSIDMDVYLMVAKPGVSYWATNGIDISFNNADLLNPTLIDANNQYASLNTSGNITSLTFQSLELPLQEQIFIGKLRFDYKYTPGSLGGLSPSGGFTISSDFIVESSTNLACINDDGSVSNDFVIESYDSEDMTFHWSNGIDSEILPYDIEELGGGKLNNVEISSHIQLFPNPAKNHINISVMDQFEIADVSIFDVGGKMVHQSKIKQSNVSIDVANFENGLYVVSVTTKSKHYKSKFLVQKK